MKRFLLFALLLGVAAPLSATTHYIRTDGGTSLQCDGLTNAAYTGGTSVQWVPNTHYTVGMTVADQNNRLQTITTAGTSGTRFQPSWGTTVGATSTSPNGGTEVWTAGAALLSAQHCAMNNPIWLATHNNSSTTAFAWTTAANDTIQFEDTGSYYMGTAIGNSVGTSWQVCVGDEADCALPRLPNGTHYLGFGAGSCHASNTFATWNPTLGSPLVNATKLLAINHNFDVIDVSATSNVDVECFDISQPDVCTQVGATTGTITHSALASGTASFNVTMTSSQSLLAPGMFVQITGTTNGGGILNVTGQVASVVNTAPPTVVTISFTLTGISGSAASAVDTGTVTFTGECVPGVNNYGTTGIILSNLTAVGPTNLTMKDVYVHGMSSRGLGGAHFNTLATDVSNISDVYLFANGDINYDGDGDNGTFGSESIGTINWTDIQSWWAGCIDNHNLGTVNLCIDQTYGGAGDNVVMIASGKSTWNWTNVKLMFGTQDGFDSLHTGDDTVNQPTTIVVNAYAEGNEGASLKGGGGARTSFKNSIGIASCDALSSGTVGASNPAGWSAMLGLECRAGDGGSFTIGPGDTLELDNDTFVGKQSTSLDIGDIDAPGGAMDSTSVAIVRNTTFMGFNNSFGQVGGLFLSSANNINPFANAGGVMTHNSWFNMKVNSTVGTACPQNVAETNAVCTDPKFTAEASVYAFNPIPLSGSPLIAAGITYTGIPTTDYFGVATTTPPVIGAATSGGAVLPVISISIAPTSATVGVGTTATLGCTATLSDSSTEPCPSPTWTSATPANVTVNASTGVVTGVAVGTSLVSASITLPDTTKLTSNNSTITVATGNHYTVTSSHRTSHVGDELPPCDVIVKLGTVLSGGGSAIWATPPTCSVGATAVSPVGTYTITVTPGTLASGSDSATYTNGSLAVIAPDGIGAKLVNAFVPNNGSTTPPAGFFSNLPYAVMNVASNQLCNMAASDSVGETNWDCFQYLQAALRGAQTGNVTCTGTNGIVTEANGVPFTGMTPSGPINIGGLWFTISSITDATHLVVSTTCSLTGTQTIYLPRTMVAVVAGSPNVTYVSGPQLGGLTTLNLQIQLGTVTGGKISTVTDATHIVMNNTLPLPVVTGTVPLYVATLISGGSAGARPLFLYVPCGQFKINHPINSYGAYMSWWGQGQCSELFLPPNSPDFASGQHQFVSMNPVNSNDSFHVFLSNLWVHTGVGNPGVIPLQFPASNYGRIENILQSSDDAMCPIGLNLGKQYTGPEMIYNVADYGCAIGVSSSIPNHNVTAEYMTIEGQTSVGISNGQDHEQFRKVLMDEPGILAVTNSSASASLVFMNSEIFDNGGAVCMQNSTTALAPSVVYMRDVNVHGSCPTTLNDYGTGTLVSTSGNIGEVWTGPAQTLFDSALTPASLNLPIVETPQPNDPAVSTWCAGGPDPTTWQASINACAATTWYLPPAQYGGSGPITINVPDTINHLQFFGAMPTTGATYHVTFNIAGTSTTPLIFENCIQSQCAINHTGSRTLVLKDDNTYNYACTVGAGNLFVDDTILGGSTNTNGGVTFCKGQSIWMRQSNQEQATQPKLTCVGNTIWILGQKTEHNGPNLTLEPGCRVELLGGEALGDPAVQGSGGDIAISTDSSLSMAAFTMATQCTITQTNGPCNNAFYFWVDETRAGVEMMLPIAGAQTVGGTQTIGLFYSNGVVIPAFVPFQGGTFITGRIN